MSGRCDKNTELLLTRARRSFILVSVAGRVRWRARGGRSAVLKCRGSERADIRLCDGSLIVTRSVLWTGMDVSEDALWVR